MLLWFTSPQDKPFPASARDSSAPAGSEAALAFGGEGRHELHLVAAGLGVRGELFKRNAVILRGGQRLYFLSYKRQEAPKEPVRPSEERTMQTEKEKEPPTSDVSGAWMVDPDGVSRLVNAPVLGK
ncbi:MAG: hypothetical protein WC661_17470 [Opitutaceae bacterium]|jgi:hypothetical protein